MSTLRPAARVLRTTAPRRFYAAPGPQPSMTKPASNPPKGSSNVPILLAVVAVAGGGYWYATNTGKDEEVKQKAKELKDAGEARAHELKKEGEAKYDNAKRDAGAKYDEAKAKAEGKYQENKGVLQANYDKAKDKVESTVDQTRVATHDAVESAKAKGSSWWGWGSGKAEEGKKDAAGKVEEGAAKVQKEASKRT
ncbi:hypothetical protein CPB86DRAFT_790582 [Serendipita vermifera]|nr:hypothetical protein CPB86DRAFT_790582 [Serendipita vermifera]